MKDKVRKASDVRMFAVGDFGIHRGYVCRVEKVERDITAVTRPSLSYMGVKDGTEFNPTLTLLPLFGPSGEAVKRATTSEAPSGAVQRVGEEVEDILRQIARLEARLVLLRSLVEGA